MCLPYISWDFLNPLTSCRSFGGYILWDFLHRYKIVVIWLPFWLKRLFIYFFALLHWLQRPALCCRGVTGVDILPLFPSLGTDNLWVPVVLIVQVWLCLSQFVHAFVPIRLFLDKCYPQFSIVQFSCSAVSDSLRPHGLQYARLPCPSPTPRAYSNSCPLSQWCHPTISSSFVPFSFHLQSFPISGSFPKSQFFTPCGQSIGISASASVLPMSIQDWFPLGWTGWISLQSKGLSRVSSNTIVQKHQCYSKLT